MKLRVGIHFPLFFFLFGHFGAIVFSYQILEPYELNRAKDYLMLAYSAYCSAESLQKWNCFWCHVSEIPQIDTVFFNDTYNIYGYVGFTDTKIIVAFRGTQFDSLTNWINNLYSAEKTFYEPAGKTAEITNGFYDDYLSVRPIIMNAIVKLREKFPTLPVVLTGHSLGGALSSLCAIDLADTLGITGITEWTFGSPRIGNEDFIRYFQTKVVSWRTVNQRDIVPHLPLLLEGFYHVPREVWFSENSVDFTVCDTSGEDPACSDSLDFADSIADHLDYLGYFEPAGKLFGC